MKVYIFSASFWKTRFCLSVLSVVFILNQIFRINNVIIIQKCASCSIILFSLYKNSFYTEWVVHGGSRTFFLFLAITCFFAINLKNQKLCYLKLNCSSSIMNI